MINRWGALAARIVLALALIVPSVNAVALGVSFQALIAGAGAAPFSYTERTAFADTTDATTYSTGSWAGIAIGTAPAGSDTRCVGALITSRDEAGNNAALVSATIGGVAATLVGQSGGAGVNAGLIIASVPTGTTATVSPTFGGSISGAGALVFTLINPGTGCTPSATANTVTNSSGVITLSLNVPTGGASVAGVVVRNNSAVTFTWSAAVTARLASTDLSTDDYTGFADGTTAGSPATITATSSDTSLQASEGFSASWGP